MERKRMASDQITAPPGFVIDDDITPPPGFKIDQPEPWSNVPMNAVKDVGGMIKGGLEAARNTLDPAHLTESAMAGSLEPSLQVFKNAPANVASMGKQLYEGAKDLVTHPIETFKKHPINTALNVAGAADLGLNAIGMMRGAGAAGATAEAIPPTMADDAVQLAPEANAPEPTVGTTASVPGATAVESVPMGSTFQETVNNLGRKVPPPIQEPLQQVKDFISQKYGETAAKPGFGDVAGDVMLRKAQGMRFRELGGTPGQARVLTQKLGEDALRDITDFAKEKGITRSPIGASRRAATKALNESSGRAIGGIREMAAKRGAIHDPNSLVSAIREELDPIYLGKGGASSEKGAYLKALQDIKASASTPDSVAQKITEMNRRAVKNKLTQPTGATTDVANAASRINNDLIQKHLSPEEFDFYKQSLNDFKNTKIINKLQNYEVGREMAGRSSGIGGLWGEAKDTFMKAGGSKVLENFYDTFGKRLKSGAPNTIGALSEGALEDILTSLDDALHEFVPPK